MPSGNTRPVIKSNNGEMWMVTVLPEPIERIAPKSAGARRHADFIQQ